MRQISALNNDKKLEEIKNVLRVWTKGHQTPVGKIPVIKTLTISKIILMFAALPDPTDQFMHELEVLFFFFLNSCGMVKTVHTHT